MADGQAQAWFSTGFGGLQQEEQRVAQMSGPNRFWLPVGVKKQFVFVDDEPATLYEHNPKIDGDWKNWLTCLQALYSEVACCAILGPQTRYYVGYFTVIDLSEYTDKKGNKHQYEMKFLPAKLKTLKKFKRRKEERGSLVGCIYSAIRDDDKGSNVGEEFEYIREADMTKLFQIANFKGKKLPEHFAQAAQSGEALDKLKASFQIDLDADGKPIPKIPRFNYANLLQPREPKEVRAWLSRVKVDSGGEGDGSGGGSYSSGGGAAHSGTADEEVPF